MNRCISFDVTDNVVKRRDGFNPVRGERNYTKLRFYFKSGYGWDNCEILTCSFFVSADQMIKSEPAIYDSDTGCAEFTIPAEYQGFSGRLFVGVQGTYEENGKAVTISSNVTCIDVSKGLLVSEGASQELYEKVMLLIKQISGGNVSSVLDYGAVGDGVTDDSVAVRNAVKNSNILIFPPGRYKITGAEFEGLSDKTLIFKDAGLIYGGENDGSVLKFSDCDNISISGGVFDGSNTAKFGLNFVNTTNVKLDNVSVKNIGNENTASTSGINFTGDCSYSKLNNVYVDGVTSGQSDGSYIFAHGIGFSRSSKTGTYSKYVEINHPVIKSVGYVGDKNYVDATAVKDSDGEITGYMVGNNACKADIIEEVDGEYRARIDGDGVFIVQTWWKDPTDAHTIHDGIESYFKINNVDISHCSKRALKIAARCVDVDGGEIDVDTWSAAVEVQRVRNNSLRNLNITDTAYTPVTINGGDGPMVIENCRITGGGMSSNGSGGIVLGAKSTGLIEGSEIVHIKNCVFDNVRFPIYAAIDSAAAGKTDCEELVIKDCLIKHFYGDAAVKLEAGRYQRLGKLTIENVSFLYGDSGREVYKANNDFYNQSISLSSHLFKILISPEESLKVICHGIIDNLREKFKSFNLSTPRQVFEEPLQPTDVFEITEHLDMTDGNYTSSEDSAGNVFTAEVYDEVIVLDAENAFQSAAPLLEIPLASNIELNPGDNITLSVRNSKPRQNYSGNSADNALLVNFYTASGGNLAYNDQNYSASTKGYAAHSALKEYAIKLNNSMVLSKLAVTLNFSGTGTVTPGTELKISVKTEKLLASSKGADVSGMEAVINKVQSINSQSQTGDNDKYPSVTAARNYVNTKTDDLQNYIEGELNELDKAKADKADTNAQFERLIAVLQSKAGKAETLAGYGINDAYTKAEVDALVSANAKSAYEIAVENGYSGTEEQWLASLKGETGATGAKGDKGDPGQDYVLTAQDKSDIADIVLGKLPTTQGVLYGN